MVTGMVDLAQLKIEADSSQLVKAEADLMGLTNAGRAAEQQSQRAGAALDQVGTMAAKTGTRANAAASQVGNMTAQLNDIGVMLVAGQNPFILAVQQGTQINQVFQQMNLQGKGTRDVFRTLTASFRAMVSPMSLIVIGTIAAGASLVQLGRHLATAGRDTRDLEDIISSLEETMSGASDAIDTAGASADDLRDRFGSAADMVRSFNEEAAKIADISINRDLAAMGDAVDEVTRRLILPRDQELSAFFGVPERRERTFTEHIATSIAKPGFQEAQDDIDLFKSMKTELSDVNTTLERRVEIYLEMIPLVSRLAEFDGEMSGGDITLLKSISDQANVAIKRLEQTNATTDSEKELEKTLEKNRELYIDMATDLRKRRDEADVIRFYGKDSVQHLRLQHDLERENLDAIIKRANIGERLAGDLRDRLAHAQREEQLAKEAVETRKGEEKAQKQATRDAERAAKFITQTTQDLEGRTALAKVLLRHDEDSTEYKRAELEIERQLLEIDLIRNKVGEEDAERARELLRSAQQMEQRADTAVQGREDDEEADKSREAGQKRIGQLEQELKLLAVQNVYGKEGIEHVRSKNREHAAGVELFIEENKINERQAALLRHLVMRRGEELIKAFEIAEADKARLALNRALIQSAQTAIQQKEQELQAYVAIQVAAGERARALRNEISVSEAIAEFGENSAAVERVRNQIAEDGLRLRLANMGYTTDQIDAEIELLRLSKDAEKSAEARTSLDRTMSQLASDSISKRQQELEAYVAMQVAAGERIRTMRNEISVSEAIAEFGVNSVAVERLRNQVAEDNLRLRLANMGYTTDQIDAEIELLRLSRDAEKSAESRTSLDRTMAQLADQVISKRQQELDAYVAMQIAAGERIRTIRNEISVNEAIAEFGESSVAVERVRNQLAEDNLRLRLANMGYTTDQIDAEIELLRLSRDAEKSAESRTALDRTVAQLADQAIAKRQQELDSYVAMQIAAGERIRTIRNEISVSEAIAEFGANSVAVERVKNQLAEDGLRLRLANMGYTTDQIDAEIELLRLSRDAEKSAEVRTSLDRTVAQLADEAIAKREQELEAYVAMQVAAGERARTIRNEISVSEAIAEFGVNSVAVERVRNQLAEDGLRLRLANMGYTTDQIDAEIELLRLSRDAEKSAEARTALDRTVAQLADQAISKREQELEAYVAMQVAAGERVRAIRNEISVSEAIAEFGANSVAVEHVKNQLAEDGLRLRLANMGYTSDQIDAEIELLKLSRDAEKSAEARTAFDRIVAQLADQAIAKREQELDAYVAMQVAAGERVRSIRNEISVSEAIAEFGESSVAVERVRNQLAEDNLRLKLANMGYTSDQIDAEIELLRLSRDAEESAEVRTAIDRTMAQLADEVISKREQELSAYVAMQVAAGERIRAMRDEISVSEAIVQFGVNSVAVERLRNQVAEDNLRLRLANMGYTTDQIDAEIELLRLSRDAEKSAESRTSLDRTMAQLADQVISKRQQEVESYVAMQVAAGQRVRSMRNEISVSEAIAEFGENSVAVERIKNQIAEDSLRLKLADMGYTSDQIDAEIELLRLSRDAEKSAKAKIALDQIALRLAQELADAREKELDAYVGMQIAAGMRARILRTETSINEEIVAHGEKSTEVEQARNQVAEDNLRIKLASLGHTEDEIDAEVDLLRLHRDAERAAKERIRADREAEQLAKRRKKFIEETAIRLENEMRISEVMIQHGRDSVEIKRLERDIALELFQIELDRLQISGPMRDALIQMHEAAANLREQAERAQPAFDRMNTMIDGLANAWGDWIARGFEDFDNFADNIKNVFRRLLADMIAEAARNQIKIALGMSVAGLAGSGAQAAGLFGGAAGGGGIGTGILTGAMIGSFFGSGGAAGGGLLGGLGLLGSFGLEGAAGTGLLGGLQQTLGAQSLGGFFGVGGSAAAAGGGIMATIGAALPVIGALAALPNLFGRKTVARDEGLRLAFEEGVFDADYYQSVTTQRTGLSKFFGGRKTRVSQTRTPIEGEELELLQSTVDSVMLEVQRAAEILGIGSDAIENFTFEANISFEGLRKKYENLVKQGQLTQAQADQALATEKAQRFSQELGKMQEALAAVILEAEGVSHLSGQAAKTLAQLSGFVETVERLGIAFDASKEGALSLAQQTLTLFGDQFPAAAQAFYQNFYTEAERMQRLREELAEVFSGMGVSMPSSRQQFRELVEAQDLATEEGRELFHALLTLSGAFAQVTDETKGLDKSLEEFERRLAEIRRQRLVNEVTQRAGLVFGVAQDAAGGTASGAPGLLRTAGSGVDEARIASEISGIIAAAEGNERTLAFEQASQETRSRLEDIIRDAENQTERLNEFFMQAIRASRELSESAAFEIFTLSVERLGVVFDAASGTAQSLSQEVVRLFGDIGQFQQQASAYYQNFFTQEERVARLRAELGQAFESLGVSMPSSRQQFRELVEAQDLTTEEGRKLFQTLLSLSAAFAQVTEGADTLDQRLDDFERRLAQILRERILKETEAAAQGAVAAAREAKSIADSINLTFGERLHAPTGEAAIREEGISDLARHRRVSETARLTAEQLADQSRASAARSGREAASSVRESGIAREIARVMSQEVGDARTLAFESASSETRSRLSRIFADQELSAEDQSERLKAQFESAAEASSRYAAAANAAAAAARRQAQQSAEQRQLSLFTAAIRHLGTAFNSASDNAAKLAGGVVELFDDIDQFQARVASYYRNFFTEEERLDQIREELGLIFGNLGIAMPQTRDEFRSLVEAQDLTTESSRRLFATLIDIADSFAAVTEEVEETKNELSGIEEVFRDFRAETFARSASLSDLRPIPSNDNVPVLREIVAAIQRADIRQARDMTDLLAETRREALTPPAQTV